jgi:hypothetical protein
MVTYGEIYTAVVLASLGLLILYFLRKAPWKRRRLAPILNLPQIFRERPVPSRRKVVIRSQPIPQSAVSPRVEPGRISKTVIIHNLSQNSVLSIERTQEGYCCLCGDVASPRQSLRFGLPKRCPCGRSYHTRCIRWAQSVRRERCRCGRELPRGL